MTKVVHLPGELWKPFAIGRSIYAISNMGRLLSKGRFLTGRAVRNGYVQDLLANKTTIYRHRLVMNEWKGPLQGLEINHKNCDVKDNRLENLEYVTHTENMKHASQNERLNRGREVWTAKLWPPTVRKIRRLYESGLSTRAIAKIIGIGKTNVHQIIARKSWAHIA